MQVLTRGHWRTFASKRADARAGRWGYSYRFTGTRGVQRYRFRALVTREAGFPYVSGTSRRVRVTVRGVAA